MQKVDLEEWYRLTLEQQRALEEQDIQKLVDVTNKKQEIINACNEGIYVLNDDGRRKELLSEILELEKANLDAAARLREEIISKIANIRYGKNAIRGYLVHGHDFSAYVDKRK